MLFICLTGTHPLGTNDLRGRLFPPELDSADVILDASELRSSCSSAVASLCEQMLAIDVNRRPSARECMCHQWLSSESPEHDRPLDREKQEKLRLRYADAKLRQVACNHVVSELTNGPFACVGPLLDAVAGERDSKFPPKLAAAKLRRLGVSEPTIDKVLSCSDDLGTVSLAEFARSCGDLAEDRLDHALWRVFTAVGEDHRGVVSAKELEQVLSMSSGSSGGSDWSGGAENYIRGVCDPELTAAEIIQCITKDSQDVHFDRLKDFVVRRQREACVAASSPNGAIMREDDDEWHAAAPSHMERLPC